VPRRRTRLLPEKEIISDLEIIFMDTITPSSGNVFADVGLPDAVELKAKVKLAFALNNALAERSLRQIEVAEILGCTQPEVSALANYKLAGFSMARLLEFLTDLDRDVEISIRKTDHHGQIVIQAA
jgi:predicted XRE-type DNA-binding protein